MAIVKMPDGRLVSRPVHEARETHKVTDHVRDRLSGLYLPKDVTKEYWKDRALKELRARKKK